MSSSEGSDGAVWQPRPRSWTYPMEEVTLRLVQVDGTELVCQVKRTVGLGSLFEKYIATYRIPEDSVVFFYRGSLVRYEQTADQLGLLNNDSIEVISTLPRAQMERTV